MSKLVITRGLPGCGKSTRARAWVLEDPDHRAEVNRDAIRLMLGGFEVGTASQEAMVTKVSHNSIADLLRSGVDVVCSDCNLAMKYVTQLYKIANNEGAEIEVWDMTDVSLARSQAQNLGRTDKTPVPWNVLKRMHERNIKGKGYPLPLPDMDSAGKAPDFYYGTGRSDALVVDICNIDGTVADHGGVRSPYDYTRVAFDNPRRVVIDVLFDRWAAGRKLIFVSGRPDVNNVREDTEAWISRYVRLPYEALLMRPADRLQVNDAIIKRDLFDDHIRGRYDIGVVFDDRDRVVSMWRKQLGLDCLQFNYGDF